MSERVKIWDNGDYRVLQEDIEEPGICPTHHYLYLYKRKFLHNKLLDYFRIQEVDEPMPVVIPPYNQLNNEGSNIWGSIINKYNNDNRNFLNEILRKNNII